MALHDAKLMVDAGDLSVAAKLKDPEIMEERPYRPFRRKAALQAEAARKRHGDTPALPVQRETLPMRLPEPWLRLREVSFGTEPDNPGHLPLVNYHRDTPVSKAFDALRTRLLRTLKERGWKRVAVAAPTRGCGATFTAVNLALSFARVPQSRTVLADLNMRDPGVADAMGIDCSGAIRDLLRGDRSVTDHFVRSGDTLALALNDRVASDASDLLLAPVTQDVLETMCSDLNPDVVICDMPAMLEHDDMSALAPNVDGVLLVADGRQTTAEHIRMCEAALGPNTPLLGVVLNRGRD